MGSTIDDTIEKLERKKRILKTNDVNYSFWESEILPTLPDEVKHLDPLQDVDEGFKSDINTVSIRNYLDRLVSELKDYGSYDARAGT